MKKILLLIVIVFYNMQLFSQQIYLEIGKTISSFDYENSQGQPLDNLLSASNSYMAFGYRKFFSNNLGFSVGAVYNGYGAIGSDRVLDNYFEWDLSYLGVSTGLDVSLFKVREFTFYAKATVSLEFLIRGTQTVNNQVYNLVGEDEFNNYIFFVRGSVGMKYPISNNTSITANYSLGKTALISNETSNDQEKLNLLTHQFGIGFTINLPNCNCPY